jgi:F-type H+-transporting ATPase subunit delta
MNSKIIISYSKCLFLKTINNKKIPFQISNLTLKNNETISSPDIEYIGEELSLLRAIFNVSSKTKAFLCNPTYSEKQKLNILLSILPGLSLTMKAFLKLLTERNHISLLPDICEIYQKSLLKAKNYTKVKLTFAGPLKSEFGPKLLKSLKNLTNSENIILDVSYNPKLLGGVIIEYNSMIIDASLIKDFRLFFNENQV